MSAQHNDSLASDERIAGKHVRTIRRVRVSGLAAGVTAYPMLAPVRLSTSLYAR